ncbi:MAG: hypothetical protein LBR28_01015 [Bacteroidales bacterium]|jgi:tetratricopeptide (TPR) repeat protein|nr:hypothetical protein [Bacteroidales bacterium]
MDKTNLNSILTAKDNDLTLQAFLNIARMSEKFPYSSLLHLYKAKISEKIHHLDSEDALHDAAAICPDRCILKKHIDKIHQLSIINKEKYSYVDKKNSHFSHKENEIKEDIIDKFLKNEIAIKPTNKIDEETKFEIEKNVKGSVNDDFKFVTETMAKVYLKQGNKDKAIKIYKQLIADNPKKSIYFANQIKRIIEDN